MYKTVVRLAMMYAAETWTMKKAQVGCDRNQDVEMDVFVTKLDRIRNDRI